MNIRPASQITAVITVFLLAWAAIAPLVNAAPKTRPSLELPADVVHDKIRGGLLGQILGNLNGLPHEMKYINEPGNVTEYTPALPEGARTDDDTDIEWVYIVEMQKLDTLLLSPRQIADLWKNKINKSIWCANQYARQIMDIGLEPPLTGSIVFNPWADFNISGQFVCETFALVAPAMPQTAARIGLNYTRVAIDGEPAQATQLFTAMIATTFGTDDVNSILDASLHAIDPNCTIRQIVQDVRHWHQLHPGDWRTTRQLIKEKYSKYNGAMRDRNGYELNTASTIAALLYGRGDFIETLKTAFNFGWDADNNAATAGTVLGVMKGYRWMMRQGWNILDRYHNTTRDNMPTNETITSFADRVIDLAEKVIIQQGGERLARDGRTIYRIRLEQPANTLRLSSPLYESAQLRAQMQAPIEKSLITSSNDRELAFAAYSAICLDLAQSLRQRHPAQWAKAIEALNQYPKVLQVLFFDSSTPAGAQLRQSAVAAGLNQHRP